MKHRVLQWRRELKNFEARNCNFLTNSCKFPTRYGCL